MRKMWRMVLVAALGVSLAACSGGGATPSSDGLTSGEQSQSESSEPTDDAIKIDQIDYEVTRGVDGGTRRAMFSYTNNSDYAIVDLRLELLPKEDASSEDIESAFDYIIEQGSTVDDIRDGMMVCRIPTIVESGSQSPENTFDFAAYYVNNVEQYELMEPDLMTIRFLCDGKIYEEYYDYRSQTYDLSSDVVETDQWGEGEICALMPRPTDELVVDIDETDTRFSFDTEGSTQEGFSAYVDACRGAGFTENVADTDTTYYADNTEGTYHLSLFYDGYSGSITAYVDLITE